MTTQTEPRFWLLDYDPQDHTLTTDNLIGIVDEDAGGIIAWAMGDENARLILKALSA